MKSLGCAKGPKTTLAKMRFKAYCDLWHVIYQNLQNIFTFISKTLEYLGILKYVLGLFSHPSLVHISYDTILVCVCKYLLKNILFWFKQQEDFPIASNFNIFFLLSKSKIYKDFV